MVDVWTTTEPPSNDVALGTDRRWRAAPADVLLAITFGAIALAWWPLVVALQGPRPIQFMPLLAHVCGMAAGYGVLVLLALMSRAPALERGVGADVLTRWHAAGGRMGVGLVVVHAWAATVAWSESRREGLALAGWHVIGLPGLAVTTAGTLLLLGVAVASARSARHRLSFEAWHAIHLLTYVSVAMTFLHQLAGPDLAGRRPLQLAWALLYANVFALLVRHRVIAPLRQASRHRLRVVSVVPETPGVVSIEMAGEHLDELRAEPGQFLRWRFLTQTTGCRPTPSRCRPHRLINDSGSR